MLVYCSFCELPLLLTSASTVLIGIFSNNTFSSGTFSLSPQVNRFHLPRGINLAHEIAIVTCVFFFVLKLCVIGARAIFQMALSLSHPLLSGELS